MAAAVAVPVTEGTSMKCSKETPLGSEMGIRVVLLTTKKPHHDVPCGGNCGGGYASPMYPCTAEKNAKSRPTANADPPVRDHPWDSSTRPIQCPLALTRFISFALSSHTVLV